MSQIDVFNGDADGLCSLLQLRLANPVASQLVSGVKRDIALLDRVQAGQGDQVTVLDISLDKNRDGLLRILEQGASVFYSDHHFAGEIPEHSALEAHINTAADVCTALLINGYLKNAYAEWAVVGAFGDNLRNSAQSLAQQHKLREAEVAQLENLGIYLNYNGYGASVDDLHFHPEALFKELLPFARPQAFISDGATTFAKLQDGYNNDMAAAADIAPIHAEAASAVVVLPNAAWARRVSGVYSNDLANAHPDRAHAVLTEKDNGNYLVSIRAPLNNKQGADEFCRRFPTGGGRAAAAGINDLPGENLATFVDDFGTFYRGLSR